MKKRLPEKDLINRPEGPLGGVRINANSICRAYAKVIRAVCTHDIKATVLVSYTLRGAHSMGFRPAESVGPGIVFIPSLIHIPSNGGWGTFYLILFNIPLYKLVFAGA